MKNKYWLIAFSVLCLICAGAWMALPNKSECHVVEIYQNSKLLYTIDLNAVQGHHSHVHAHWHSGCAGSQARRHC